MNKNRTAHIITVISVALFIVLGLASGTTEPATNTGNSSGGQGASSSTASSPYFTGNGGKGISLGILVPESQGISDNLAYLPTMVQGVLVSTISKYSSISVLDRVSLDKVIAETLDPTYQDNLDIVRLGHVAQVGNMMTGKIIRTSTGYTLQINVTDTTPNARTIASYSGTCTVAELDNQTAIQKASHDLLTQMGIQLTNTAKAELGTMNSRQSINAQTALAKGVTAQKQGTEVTALSYYYQAAALDSSLLEAASRVNILFANITSGNIGEDTRNDIQWRRDWIVRLTECEDLISKTISAADPPYSLFYCTELKKGDINYQTETISLSFETNLHGVWTWFSSVQKAVQAVYDGLNATKRKSDWGLASWPQQSLSKTDPFSAQYTVSVAFELVNAQNRVIGSQTLSRRPAFRFLSSGNQIATNYDENDFNTVTFNAVKADDISDIMTIRVANVNRAAPENTPFQITALSPSKWQEYRNGLSHLDIRGSVLRGFNSSLSDTQIKQYRNLVLPEERWGEPFIFSIADDAFREAEYDSFARSLSGKGLISVTIPYGVTSIGKRAFADNNFTSITIPNSVTSIEGGAFYGNPLTSVTIGANVSLESEAISYLSTFEQAYYSNERKAGTYTRKNTLTLTRWSYSPR